MTLVNTETGELVEALDAAAAERRAMKISLRLDAIADNYEAVMPMIREAIEMRDDMALGYRSPGDYVSDRFGGALQRLGMDVRRAVVGELTAAGLSTRAIAPVVGVTQQMVVKDLRAIEGDNRVVTSESSEDEMAAEYDRQRGYDRPSEERSAEAQKLAEKLPVIGIDGKTYSRPAAPRVTPRRSLPDVARDLGIDLRRLTERVERLHGDDRFARNKNEVAAHLRHHLVHALQVLTDLEQEINSHKESTNG